MGKFVSAEYSNKYHTTVLMNESPITIIPLHSPPAASSYRVTIISDTFVAHRRSNLFNIATRRAFAQFRKQALNDLICLPRDVASIERGAYKCT
jgi:hypothetical protein